MPGELLPIKAGGDKPELKPFTSTSALASIATFYGVSSSSEEDNDEDEADHNVKNVKQKVLQVESTKYLPASELSNVVSELNCLENVKTEEKVAESVPFLQIPAESTSEFPENDVIPQVNSESANQSKIDSTQSNNGVCSLEPEKDNTEVPPSCENQAFTEIRSETKPDSSSSETSDSDSDSDSSSDDSDTLSDSDEEGVKLSQIRNGPRVKGEQRLSDLPPIEDLHISVPHDQCRLIGTVKSFVDPLVIVAGDINTPALDLDSVLFLDEGDRALGKVFDVFGPVKEPHYCVRFNSKDHIDSLGIKCGMKVYCAPETPHSSFIFLAQLARFRGTDASWKYDIEPPADQQEFSDDEMEEFAKKGGRRHVRKVVRDGVSSNQAQNLDSASNVQSVRGRKRQFNNSSQQRVNVPHPNAYIPPNVPGFRTNSHFPRNRNRGYPAPRFGYGYSNQFLPPRPPFCRFPPHPPNFGMVPWNDSQYWSSYWQNYYQPGQPQTNPEYPPSPHQFYQGHNMSEAYMFNPQPPPPPPPPPMSGPTTNVANLS